MLKKTISQLAFLLIFNVLQGQTAGWDFVKSNDFVQAKAAFESALTRNPTDREALVGSIFIAETLQDYDAYRNTANRLMADRLNWNFFWLFGHNFEGTAEQALTHPWPEFIRAKLIEAQADTLFKSRRFEESAALARSLVPDWEWKLAGPFTNVQGSGFVETTAVETQPFDPAAVFKNENGLEFRWYERRIFEPGSRVTFEHLPGGYGFGTFYANTFVDVPTARFAQISLTRHEPIKIWLDDQLIFSNEKQVPDQVDFEFFTFYLPAGTHRILVKISDFPDDDTNSKLPLAFNEVYDDFDGEPRLILTENRHLGGGTIGSAYRRYNQEGFILRLCEPETGRIFTDVKSSFRGTYTPAKEPWKTEIRSAEGLTNFKNIYQREPTSLSAQYLLAKAFALSEAWEEGEEFFVRLHREHPQSAFVKFLLAKFYDANDKGEKAEALLSEMDTVLAPTFAEHFSRLGKIDKSQNETGFVAMLEHILALSPRHFQVLSTYLEFLKEKGKEEQVKGYVRNFLEKNKDEKWKNRLKDYLEDESYKPKSFKPKTDKEREKEFKEAQKRLKKRFSASDYMTLLEFYKAKEKHNEVLKTYDELLSATPWRLYYRFQKARYLFEIERFDEALELFREQLKWRPYDGDVLESIGDIYIEKKNEAEALNWYRQAEKLTQNRWGGGELAEKIEKLENEKKYTGYFPNIVLDEAAKDMNWHEKYRDEESVIALFAQQATFKKDKKSLETFRKMVIHILSDAGAKAWTEADFRQIGQITSAKILKKDGSVMSPDMDYNYAVFKNLQAGDVILVEGSDERSMDGEIPDEILHLDFLSWPAPVAKSTLDLLLPREQEVFFTCNRIDCQSVRRDTGDFKMLSWVWRDLPKMQGEEASPQNLDEMAYLMMGSAPDWSRVVEWYLRKTYLRTRPNYEVLEKARELITPGMTKPEIVERLHNFITKEINYSYVPFLNTSHIPKKPGATLSGKVGDCKDVAGLMISLLRENGIPAWFTLVETHSFSRQEPRPTLYTFNHAIVAYEITPGELLFADLTTDYYPHGIVPEFDSDSWALVVREGETKIRRLPNHALDETRSRVEIQAKAVVDSDKNISLELNTINHGCPAGRWREELIPATPEDRRKKLSEYFGGGVLTHLDFGNIEFENFEQQSQALRTRVEMKALNQLDKVSNFWIMPLPLPLSTPVQKSLFAAKRYNDLDLDDLFELAPVRETIELTLPSDFNLLEMPENQRFKSKFGEYELRFEAMPGGLRIFRNVRFAQRFVSHAEFLDFKKFYLQMLDADDSKLALKRR